MIDLAEAKRRQDELQASGRRLWQQLELKHQLSQLGEVEVQGSFAYSLMTKPDIDIHVFSEQPDLVGLADVARDYMTRPAVQRTMLNNYFDHPTKVGFPKGIYFGLRIWFEDRLWNFDVWLMREDDLPDIRNFPKGWHTRLSEEERSAVLLLRYQLMERGMYPRVSGTESFGSADVFLAVMNDGVRSVEQLLEWRRTHPYY